MADERLRTKLELKKFVATNIKRKGITDDMLSILIDVLWRDRYTLRTSGFFEPGGADTIIDFDEVTRIFSIEPFDPQITNFIPRFGFFSWTNRAIYHRVFKKEEIEIPDEEGLFAIYYGLNPETRLQQLYFIKNPTDTEIEDLYTKKVIISFIYWDLTNQIALAFGDDRHGSQWNPQHHFYQNISFHAQRYSGINVVGMEINEDGSLDSHAKFNVTSGKMWHDDFILDIPEVPAGTGTPILFSLAGAPRFVSQSGFGIFLSGARIGYNTAAGIATADNGNFVCYHIFATNEHVNNDNKVISAMGFAQYTTLGAAYYGIDTELNQIYDYIPFKGPCHLGTIILQADDSYTNSVHARIVGFSGNEIHPPVTIADDSKDYLAINEDQELSIDVTDLLGGGGGLSEIPFEFCVVAGYAETFKIDIYVVDGYTITNAILESDGTLLEVKVKINSIPITGLDSMTVSTVTVFTAVAQNVAAATDVITIEVTESYSGTPTVLRGKIVLG